MTEAKHVRVRTADGHPMDTLVSPAGTGPAPAVVILHEIFGITEFIRSRLDFFNDHGYTAMAPDLYHRVAPGRSFDYAGQGFADAFATRNRLDDDQSVGDVGAAVEVLRRMPECDGDVAIVGYCLGGLYAYLAAGRLDAQACVSFHGVRIEKRLAEARHVRVPLQMHFCGLDKHVPAAAVAAIRAALQGNDNVDIHDYPAFDHGFTRVGQPVYDAASAETAHRRLFGFFDRVMKGAD
ncbi:MAG: dienelactone hydrolase family protein [Alphaproteobacteria bacterium]|nr:dienelactone hydrolase family protein [Alphaproteobacteria bacterium]